MKKIVKLILFHCARGTRRCEKCKTLAAEGKKPCMIELYPRGGIMARPMMLLVVDGEELWFEYDVLKVFENESEARAYALENEIEIDLKD